jgi:hypothetical protein
VAWWSSKRSSDVSSTCLAIMSLSRTARTANLSWNRMEKVCHIWLYLHNFAYICHFQDLSDL